MEAPLDLEAAYRTLRTLVAHLPNCTLEQNPSFEPAGVLLRVRHGSDEAAPSLTPGDLYLYLRGISECADGHEPRRLEPRAAALFDALGLAVDEICRSIERCKPVDVAVDQRAPVRINPKPKKQGRTPTLFTRRMVGSVGTEVQILYGAERGLIASEHAAALSIGAPVPLNRLRHLPRVQRAPGTISYQREIFDGENPVPDGDN